MKKYTIIYSVPVTTGSHTSYIIQIRKFETDNIKEKVKEYDNIQYLFKGWCEEVPEIEF